MSVCIFAPTAPIPPPPPPPPQAAAATTTTTTRGGAAAVKGTQAAGIEGFNSHKLLTKILNYNSIRRVPASSLVAAAAAAATTTAIQKREGPRTASGDSHSSIARSTPGKFSPRASLSMS